jgi:membrane protein DedA with SNARE-associated domain
VETIKGLIEKYQELFYAITFAWTFLEGETFVIFAGALSVPDPTTKKALLNIYILTACAWIGSFCGDQLYFFLGRRFGKRILRRFPRIEGGVLVALDLLERYNTFFILTYRYMYGVRNFASFAMGMSNLRWARFAPLNFIAAGMWAISFAGGGYLLAVFAAEALGDITKRLEYVMLGVVVFVVLMLFIVHRISKKKFAAAKARAMERSHEGESAAAPHDPVAAVERFSRHPEKKPAEGAPPPAANPEAKPPAKPAAGA